VNRKLMVAGALAAILAIVGGAYVGRNLLFDDSITQTTAAEKQKPRRPALVVFHETISDVSLSYPGSWTRREATEDDVPLIAVAPDRTTSLLVRVSVTGLEDVTAETLPIVKEKFTDPLIKTVKLVGPARAVTLGGLLGYRYRYTYRSGDGAHDHYFLFKRGRMIALVFQATPASRLDNVQAQFDRIVASFSGKGPS